MPHKKIRIVIDVDAAAQPNKSGVGFYTLGLTLAIASYDQENVEVIGHYFNFLGLHRADLPVAKNISYKQSRLLPRKFLNVLRRFRINLPYELLIRTKADFLIFPNFLGRPSIFKTPNAPVIHDLTFLEHPEFVSARNQADLEKFVPETLRAASFVVAVSNATKDTMVRHYPWLDKTIIVGHIPPGPIKDIEPQMADERLSTLGITMPYILFMGNLEPRKNIEGIVESFNALPDDIRNKYALVLAGGKGWNNETINAALEKAKAKGNRIIETGYMDDVDRAILYTKASLFIFPSHYEGYGIPLLEAMSYRLPIIASGLTVFHEVAGDAALYCDPKDPADIAQKIIRGLTDDPLRKKLIKAGQNTLAGRNWNKIAESVVEEIKKQIKPFDA